MDRGRTAHGVAIPIRESHCHRDGFIDRLGNHANLVEVELDRPVGFVNVDPRDVGARRSGNGERRLRTIRQNDVFRRPVFIMRNELDLKPEKTQKALEALKQMSKERLSSMIHRYAKAKKREADIHHDVAQRPVMKEYEQYAVELKNVNTEIDQLQQTIAKITLPTDEQLVEDLKKALEQHKITLIQEQ